MGKIITGFEFAILVAIIIGIIILLNVMEARRRINAANSQPQDDDQAKEDEKEHRRMVHEADSYNEAASKEPPVFRNWVEKEVFLAQAEADRQARSRQAVRRAQYAAHDSSKGKPNPFILTADQEREANEHLELIARQDEQRRDEIRQHNSSFRALGMTPISLYSRYPKS